MIRQWWLWVGWALLCMGCDKKPSVHFEPITNSAPQFPASDSTSAWSGEQLAYRYCQTCHAFPEPGLLSKSVWTESVLPRMGHYLGIRESPQQPYRGMSMYDELIVRKATIFPDEPKISRESWQKLLEYYEQQAPDSLPTNPAPSVDTVLSQFEVHPVQLPNSTIPITTLTRIDTLTGHLWLGDAQGTLHTIDNQQQIIASVKLDSPPSDIHLQAKGSYQVLTMGIMNPSDRVLGKLWQSTADDSLVQLIPTELRRPVHFNALELADGREAWLVAEFGNYLGQLVYYESSPAGFRKQLLTDYPGARKTEVSDVNQDGLADITTLVAQGDERIITWYNQGDGQYSPKVLLRFPPVYGSSYFELADMNQDGRLDILYTNGDNADYSTVLKPYHGIRVFLQSAEGRFEENYFLPMPGASQAMARDFDQDGDLDIAVISFFPDFEQTPERGFLYLENQSAETELAFTARTFPEAAHGHWLTMDVGDTDQDGDLDIVLGSFTLPPSQAPDSLNRLWVKQGPHYIILENSITP